MATKWIEHQNGRIAYEEQGEGPLVVLIPSLGDVKEEYRFLSRQLAEAGYRAVSMDLRGLGESSTGWEDYSVAALGGDLLALIRSLKAGPAAVAGTSMGAAAAVWAAAEAPEAVTGLALIGPAVRGEVNGLMRLLFRVLFSRPWGPALWRRYYKGLYISRKPEDFEAYTAALETNLREAGRIEATLGLILASKKDSEERLGRVAAPVRVIMGEKDPDFKDPESEARWVAEQLRGEYRMIAGTGHYPHAEAPEKTAPLVIEFLQSLQEASQSVWSGMRV